MPRRPYCVHLQSRRRRLSVAAVASRACLFLRSRPSRRPRAYDNNTYNRVFLPPAIPEGRRRLFFFLFGERRTTLYVVGGACMSVAFSVRSRQTSSRAAMDYQCIVVYTIITILPPDEQRKYDELRLSAALGPADGCLGVVKRWIKRYLYTRH